MRHSSHQLADGLHPLRFPLPSLRLPLPADVTGVDHLKFTAAQLKAGPAQLEMHAGAILPGANHPPLRTRFAFLAGAGAGCYGDQRLGEQFSCFPSLKVRPIQAFKHCAPCRIGINNAAGRDDRQTLGTDLHRSQQDGGIGRLRRAVGRNWANALVISKSLSRHSSKFAGWATPYVLAFRAQRKH